jgi:hypothetical protein
MLDQLWGQLIMPTDLGAVVERKRKAQAEAQTDITLVLSCATIISPRHKAQRTALDRPQAKNSLWIMGDCGVL